MQWWMSGGDDRVAISRLNIKMLLRFVRSFLGI